MLLLGLNVRMNHNLQLCVCLPEIFLSLGYLLQTRSHCEHELFVQVLSAIDVKRMHGKIL